MTRRISEKAVHFPLRHPLFSPRFETNRPKDVSGKTEQGIWWEFSPYYAWFECLRRNKKYRRCCERGGKGQMSALFRDFGDVRDVTFKAWWRDGGRGIRLFGEPTSLTTVERISLDKVEELRSSVDDGSMLLVAVPLRLPKREAVRKVRSIIDKAKPSKRGDHLRHDRHYAKISRAKYRPSARVLADVVMRQLKAWDARQSGMKLREIGEMMTGPHDSYNYPVLLAHRLIRSAEALIDGVGRGEFPIHRRALNRKTG